MPLSAREGSPSLSTSAVMDTNNHKTTPRKRRRRVPASGAADDCFACRKRNMKCDRRRPYCTQCLEQGKECSGYKTQLTWGVGVASRGKLRGQALPVLKKVKPPPALSAQRARRSFSSATESSVLSRVSSQASAEPSHNPSPEITASSAVGAGYDQANVASTSSSEASFQPSPNVYHSPVTNRWTEDQGQTLYAHRRPLEALLHLHMPLASSFEDYGQPRSASSISTFSESESASNPHFPHALDDPCCLFPPVSVYDTLPYQAGMATRPPCGQADQRAPTSYPDQYLSYVDGGLSSSVSSVTSSHLDSIDGLFDLDGCHKLSSPPLNPCDSSDILFENSTSGMTIPSADGMDLGFGWESCVEHVAPDLQADDLPMCSTATECSLDMLSPQRTLHFSLASNTSYRTRYLVHYYEQTICPALVASDSAGNPFRCQLLPLAQSSDCLLYAIGALSASSLRRRGSMSTKSRSHNSTDDPGRSPIHQLLFDDGDINHFNTGRVEPVFSGNSSYQEELHLKELSVKNLNSILYDPSQAVQDSVLATLLVLCLFHACQTGIASFDTQFAGVRKLLHLRRKRVGVETPCWMTAIFAYLDVMIATINNHEPQLQEIWVDIGGSSGGKTILEMLTGCEANLFTLITSLTHLNRLNKGSSVPDGARGYHPSRSPLNPSCLSSSSLLSATSASTSASGSVLAAASSLSASSRLAGQATRDYYSLKDIVPKNKGRSHVFSNETSSICNPVGLQSNFIEEEHDREGANTFCQEWKVIRHRLQDWKPSHNVYSSDLSSSLRCAALLYIERLSAPAGLSSKHPRIQRLVSKVISHHSRMLTITNNSIFTLWPLFIAGTECVDRAQRSFIRKCYLEVCKRSGFVNGMVSLRILKQVWRELDDDDDDDVFDVFADEGMTLHGSLASVNLASRTGSLKASSSSSIFRWRKYLDEVQGEYFVV